MNKVLTAVLPSAMLASMVTIHQNMRFDLKRLFTAIAALTAWTGCAFAGASSALQTLPKQAQDQGAPAELVAAGPPSPQPAIWRDSADKNLVYLDPSVDPPQRAVIWISMGSMTIETLEVIGDQLVFDYTPEVEMGWEKRRCTVPRDQGKITFPITHNGTPGKTSFDLSACELIDSSAPYPLSRMGQ